MSGNSGLDEVINHISLYKTATVCVANAPKNVHEIAQFRDQTIQ